MKRRHEEVARAEFTDWLLESFRAPDIVWTEPVADQPRPDWYLLLKGSTYAVEATTVVPTINHGKTTVLEPSLSFAIGDFIEEVEARAKREGSLHGAYAVAIGPMPNNRRLRQDVATRILEYIRSTRDQPSAKRRTVAEVGDYEIQVQKLHMGHSYLAEMIDLGTKSHADVADDLRNQLRSTVERKAARYARFEGRVILLVLDGFHIAEPEQWLDATSKCPGIERFDAVFRIKPANKPLLLFSRSGFWRYLANVAQPASA